MQNSFSTFTAIRVSHEPEKSINEFVGGKGKNLQLRWKSECVIISMYCKCPFNARFEFRRAKIKLHKSTANFIPATWTICCGDLRTLVLDGDRCLDV